MFSFYKNSSLEKNYQIVEHHMFGFQLEGGNPYQFPVTLALIQRLVETKMNSADGF